MTNLAFHKLQCAIYSLVGCMTSYDTQCLPAFECHREVWICVQEISGRKSSRHFVLNLKKQFLCNVLVVHDQPGTVVFFFSYRIYYIYSCTIQYIYSLSCQTIFFSPHLVHIWLTFLYISAPDFGLFKLLYNRNYYCHRHQSEHFHFYLWESVFIAIYLSF